MTSETRVLATYVADLEFSDLPESVVTRTRLLVMDHVGIALRARHAADLNDAMATALQSLGYTYQRGCFRSTKAMSILHDVTIPIALRDVESTTNTDFE